ncbi:MAG: hypothetical protein UY34_C0041G0015, partial [Parcubacteria group bacterium GW2011_GWA2_48_9]
GRKNVHQEESIQVVIRTKPHGHIHES